MATGVTILNPHLWFADRMKRNFDRAALCGKHGWDQMSWDECMKGVRRELRELKDAIALGLGPEAVADECADVANYLMFLAHNAVHEED